MIENQQMLNFRLRKVLDLLDENQKELENVEQFIRDEDFKLVVLQIMRKNSEYAGQLLVSLLPDGQPCRALKKYDSCEDILKTDHNISKEELLDKCLKEESAFETTYGEVLNTGYLQDNLKRMMQSQLNELKTLFLKIRIEYMIKSNMLSPYTLRKNYP